MTAYISPIVLGQKYTDERSGLTGIATVIGFQHSGCIEVGIEQSTEKDGKVEIETTFINELRLKPADGSEFSGDPNVYESDVEFGRHYRDVQTGLEGWAAVVDFHESMTTRVTIRSIGYDKDGAKVLKYHIIDDSLLEDIETKQVADKKDNKRSPATREVTRR